MIEVDEFFVEPIRFSGRFSGGPGFAEGHWAGCRRSRHDGVTALDQVLDQLTDVLVLDLAGQAAEKEGELDNIILVQCRSIPSPFLQELLQLFGLAYPIWSRP